MKKSQALLQRHAHRQLAIDAAPSCNEPLQLTSISEYRLAKRAATPLLALPKEEIKYLFNRAVGHNLSLRIKRATMRAKKGYSVNGGFMSVKRRC